MITLSFYRRNINLPSICSYKKLNENDIMLFIKEKFDEEELFDLKFYLYDKKQDIINLYNIEIEKDIKNNLNCYYYYPKSHDIFHQYKQEDLEKYKLYLNKIKIIKNNIANF